MARQYKRDLIKQGPEANTREIERDGQNITKPLTKADYAAMSHQALINRDRCKPGTEAYYRNYRDYMLLLIGVNTGCRIEVECEMRACDFKGGRITITEFKTKKRHQYVMDKEVYAEIQKYITAFNLTDKEFLFKAYRNKYDAITRQTAWARIKALADQVGVKYTVGAHSLRKSYGRWLYDETHDIHLVQQFYMHGSAETTERYICLEKGDIDAARGKVRNLPVRA